MKMIKFFIMVFTVLSLNSCSSPELVYISNESRYPVSITYMPKDGIEKGILAETVLQPRQTKKYFLYQFMLPPNNHDLFVVSREGSKSVYRFPEVVDSIEYIEKYSHGGRFGDFTYLLKIDDKNMYIKENGGQWLVLKKLSH